LAPFTDSNAINTWGIVFANDLLYVADNGNNSITSYNTNGSPTGTVISTTGAVDGLVYNPTNNFIIPLTTSPATLLTSTEDGTIEAWNPAVSPNSTVVVANSSNVPFPGVYKGLAITSTNLYAADFANSRIDTFDSSFNLLTGFPFSDPTIPPGFAPFNIVYLNGVLYVLYALQTPTNPPHDDRSGPGNGFVNVFDTNGNFLRRLISRGYLNSPWGFISYSLPDKCHHKSVFLIGNFGDGTISAYDHKGKFLGKLEDHKCVDIIIDGLWGLANGSTPKTIFFASGPNGENNGLVGSIVKV